MGTRSIEGYSAKLFIATGAQFDFVDRRGEIVRRSRCGTPSDGAYRKGDAMRANRVDFTYSARLACSGLWSTAGASATDLGTHELAPE